MAFVFFCGLVAVALSAILSRPQEKTTCWQHSATIRACYTTGSHCALRFYTPNGVIGGTVPCKPKDEDVI